MEIKVGSLQNISSELNEILSTAHFHSFSKKKHCLSTNILAVKMDALTPCIWTIQIHVRGPSIWTTLERIIGWSKYTLTDRPNGRSGDVQLDGPNIRSLTVQMDDGPMDRPCYVNLDRPNGRRSNGPPMLRQFGPSKITVVDRYFGPS